MREILKQGSWLFLTQILTRVISFFYTIYLAKALGISDFGLFIVSLSYFSIISAVADFGFNRFLIREVSQDRLKANQLLWNITILRITLTSILFAVFALFLYMFDQDKMRVSLILLATLAILPQSIGMTFDGIFVAQRKLQFSSIALFISSLSNALIGIYLVNSEFGPIGAINALILSQLIFVAVLFFLIIKNHGLHFPKIEISVIKKVTIGSLPYGILGVLGLLYFRIDAILLSYMKGNIEVGIYGAVFRFLEAVTVVPSVFFSALFPVFANMGDEPKKIRALYFKSLKLMAGLGFMIMVTYLFVLPEVIKIYLPDYLSSTAVISILSLSIPFLLMQASAVSVLLSSDKYLKQVLMLSILTLVFNIGLNLIFIPKFGFIAASWVTVFSEVSSFAIFFLLIKKKILDKS